MKCLTQESSVEWRSKEAARVIHSKNDEIHAGMNSIDLLVQPL